MSVPPAVLEKVRASFARQGLMRSLEARLDRVEHGFVSISAPITAQVSQQHGAGHAGLTFALGDSAAGYAALSMIEGEADVMTAEMKINLLRPAVGKALLAEGRVVKVGRRLIVVQADVFAQRKDAKTLVAVLQGTMVSA